MTAAHRATPRVPATVVGATALIALNVVAFVVIAVQALGGGHWWAIFPLVLGTVEALICVGLWRGHRVAYVAAVVLGALMVTGSFSYVGDLASGGGVVSFLVRMGFGVLLLGLLLVPAGARRHFSAAG